MSTNADGLRADSDEFVRALTAFADKHGYMKAQELIDSEMEGRIEKCANCGRLTDEYNEDERRHIHDTCLGEWRGTRAEYNDDDLRDCAQGD